MDTPKMIGTSANQQYIHWSRNPEVLKHPGKWSYLPATFLKQFLTLDYFDGDQKKDLVFEFNAITQPHSTLDSRAAQTDFETVVEQFGQQRYTACRSFEKLKDTFNMAIPKESLESIHLNLYTDSRSLVTVPTILGGQKIETEKPVIPQQVVDDNKNTLRTFHGHLLRCLFHHYILGFSRVFFFLALFNTNPDVKINKGYRKLLQRAVECVRYGNGQSLCLNHFNKQVSSFCNEDTCKNIANFRVNGGELQPFFIAEGEIQFEEDAKLTIPTLESIWVKSENGLLHVRWEVENDSWRKLIKTISSQESVKSVPNEIWNPEFPKPKNNLLRKLSKVRRPPYGIIDKNFLKEWPIYKILLNVIDPYEIKGYEQTKQGRQTALEIVNSLFPHGATSGEEGYRQRLLTMIISGMWSSALESFTEKMFVSKGGAEESSTIDGVKAFLELSCLASNYLSYQEEKDKTLRGTPEIHTNFSEVGINLRGTPVYLDTIMNDMVSDIKAFFNENPLRTIGGLNTRWLYYPPGGTKSQRGKFKKSDNNITPFQQFILFIAVLLGKGNNTRNPVLGRLSASILFEDDQ
jgi:hypothetical protein